MWPLTQSRIGAPVLVPGLGTAERREAVRPHQIREGTLTLRDVCREDRGRESAVEGDRH